TRCPAQFQQGPHLHNRKLFTNMYWVSIPEFSHGKDPHRVEAFRDARADPSDLNDRQTAQHLLAGGFGHSVPDAHSPKLFDFLAASVEILANVFNHGLLHQMQLDTYLLMTNNVCQRWGMPVTLA